MAKRLKLRKSRKVREAPPVPPSGVTYQTERDGLFQSMDLGESAHWRMGYHWNNLVTYELWREGGYRSARAFLRKESRGKRVAPSAQLSDDAAVAAAFDEAIAVREGMDRLFRLLVFRKKSGRPGAPGDPADEPIDVPQRDGHSLQKRFADCSEKDMKAAVARSGRKKKTPRKSPEARSLEQDLGVLAGRTGIAWSVRDGDTGSLLVSLAGSPDDLRATLNLKKTQPLDERHTLAVTWVQTKMVRFFDAAGAPTFSAVAMSDAPVHYGLTAVSETNFEAVFDAAKQALKDFLTGAP